MLGAGLVASIVAGLSALLRGLHGPGPRRAGPARVLPVRDRRADRDGASRGGPSASGRWGRCRCSSSEFAFIVAGGIVVLLPGRTVASAFEDVISGYSVTGAGRMFGVLLTTAGIILGVATGLSATIKITTALDLALASPRHPRPAGLGRAGHGRDPRRFRGRDRRSGVPAHAGGVSCCPRACCAPPASGSRSSWPRSPGAGALAAAGLAASPSASSAGCSRCGSGRRAMVLVVPASYGLLPGLAIFRGLYEMVNGSSADAGTSRSRAASPPCSGRWPCCSPSPPGQRSGSSSARRSTTAWCRSGGPAAGDRMPRCRAAGIPGGAVCDWCGWCEFWGHGVGLGGLSRSLIPGSSAQWCIWGTSAEGPQVHTAYPTRTPARRTSSGGCHRRKIPGQDEGGGTNLTRYAGLGVKPVRRPGT